MTAKDWGARQVAEFEAGIRAGMTRHPARPPIWVLVIGLLAGAYAWLILAVARLLWPVR